MPFCDTKMDMPHMCMRLNMHQLYIHAYRCIYIYLHACTRRINSAKSIVYMDACIQIMYSCMCPWGFSMPICIERWLYSQCISRGMKHSDFYHYIFGSSAKKTSLHCCVLHSWKHIHWHLLHYICEVKLLTRLTDQLFYWLSAVGNWSFETQFKEHTLEAPSWISCRRCTPQVNSRLRDSITYGSSFTSQDFGSSFFTLCRLTCTRALRVSWHQRDLVDNVVVTHIDPLR